jgi:inactivated superfamily I helicase
MTEDSGTTSDTPADPFDLKRMKLSAQADQSVESMKVLAQMAGAFFRELLAQGMERHEAHDHAMQWVDAILDHVRPKIG